jgi:hypothetical protein
MAKKTPFYLVQADTNKGFVDVKIEAPTSAQAKRIFFNLLHPCTEIKALKIKKIGDNVKQKRLVFK